MPPLDKMRKVRREIIRTINDIRAKFNNASLHQDPLTNAVANEYAEYLLQNDDAVNEEVFKSINEKHLLQDQCKLLQGIAYLEEDIVSKDVTKKDEYMDAHGLLLELQEEMGELTSKQYTHIGIGFAHNTQKVKVVELLTSKPLHISHVTRNEDGSTEVKGCMLDAGAGVYACRVVATSNLKKEIAVSGPAMFEMNPETREFTANLKTQGMDNLFFAQDDPKYLEFFVSRRQVDKIKYGSAGDPNEKINVTHLELCLRLPLEIIPDPRTIIEDDVDAQRQQRDMEARIKRQEEQRQIQLAAA